MSVPWHRPDLVRRLNLFAPAVGGGEHIVDLDPDDLLAVARATTGLDHVGDGLYVDTFRHQLGAIDDEARLHLLGRVLCRAETLRILQTKLRLERHWADEPAVVDEPVASPLFVIGPPRTGTTILLELLALDPGLRAPLAWEAHHPLPLGTDDDPAERMHWAEAEQELWADIQPEFQSIHELHHDLPCECVHFLALDFAGPYWSMQYDTPSFGAWLAGVPDATERVYRLHRRVLQTLQHGHEPRRWLLKSPAHLASLPTLFAEYPDALVVHTHRDPTAFVASAASTITMLRWLRSDHVDPLVQGQTAAVGFRYMLDTVMTQRADGTLPAERIVDSHFADLMADPAATLRSVYDAFGFAWPAGHETTITDYLAHKPRAKYGRHVYDWDTFGLDPAAIRADYAAYVDHHGIAVEG